LRLGGFPVVKDGSGLVSVPDISIIIKQLTENPNSLLRLALCPYRQKMFRLGTGVQSSLIRGGPKEDSVAVENAKGISSLMLWHSSC
jgi:hypothetical protein